MIGKVDGEGVYVGESPRGTMCEKAQPVTSQEIGRYSVLYQTYHTAAQAEPSHSHSIHQNFPTNNQGIALRNTLLRYDSNGSASALETYRIWMGKN